MTTVIDPYQIEQFECSVNVWRKNKRFIERTFETEKEAKKYFLLMRDVAFFITEK